MAAVTLQINVAPPDATYAGDVLQHQLGVWSHLVDEVVFTLDLRRPNGEQFGAAWDVQMPEIRRLLENLAQRHPHARIAEVNYSDAARAEVATAFFGGRPVPVKDHRGGPYYSYFYGLWSADHDLVLHTDVDMMFGGGSETWLDEAIATIRDDPDVVFVNPFPGPPMQNGELGEGASYPHRRISDGRFSFDHVSTRLFLTDRRRLVARLGPLTPDRVYRPHALARAYLTRRTVYELPELMVSRAMRAAGATRIDMLGAPPGMWSLHPPVRDPAYFAGLRTLIQRVEDGDVTPEQVGRLNLHASMLAD